MSLEETRRRANERRGGNGTSRESETNMVRPSFPDFLVPLFTSDSKREPQGSVYPSPAMLLHRVAAAKGGELNVLFGELELAPSFLPHVIVLLLSLLPELPNSSYPLRDLGESIQYSPLDPRMYRSEIRHGSELLNRLVLLPSSSLRSCSF